jgi:microcystin degradation protein MlrC
VKIVIAGLGTETNAFAPQLTGVRCFEEGGVFHGDASERCMTYEGSVARLYRSLAAADGHNLIEGLFATAQPLGPTVQSVYERFRDSIVESVRTAAPEIVLLLLHGAMIATECEDCEGDLLARIRQVAPHAVIGVELDPHCHLTPLMLANSNVIILLKEYPHFDYEDRARELYGLCLRTVRREIEPVAAVFDCRMVGIYPTTTPVMAGLVQRLREAEQQPGILSASYVHGFPWGDTPEVGTKVLVVADRDAALAARTARTLGREFYRAREALLPRFPAIAESLDRLATLSGRVVMADTADNAGGGAPSDNTALLRAILERGLTEAAVGVFWDPVAAAFCGEAGTGARFTLRLGGKSGRASSSPLDLEVTVKGVREDHSQAGLGNSRQPLGLSAWVTTAGVDIVVASVRTQTFAPDAFEALGVDLWGKRLIVVKSTQHFQTRFKPFADHVIQVATPGALNMDFGAIPYRRKRDLQYFPRILNPLEAENL